MKPILPVRAPADAGGPTPSGKATDGRSVDGASPAIPATDGSASPDRLRGLGPRSVASLAAVGIETAADLRAADPFDVYLRLKRADPKVSLNMLYALIGAIESRDWRDVMRNDRTSILLRLDDLARDAGSAVSRAAAPAPRDSPPPTGRRRRTG